MWRSSSGRSLGFIFRQLWETGRSQPLGSGLEVTGVSSVAEGGMQGGPQVGAVRPRQPLGARRGRVA